MIPDDGSFLDYMFKSIVGGMFAIGARLWFLLFSRVRENERDIAGHKLTVAEFYVKKSDLDDIKATLTEVRQDIKTLLVNKQ